MYIRVCGQVNKNAYKMRKRELKHKLRFRNTSFVASDECIGPWLLSECCIQGNAFLVRLSPQKVSLRHELLEASATDTIT